MKILKYLFTLLCATLCLCLLLASCGKVKKTTPPESTLPQTTPPVTTTPADTGERVTVDEEFVLIYGAGCKSESGRIWTAIRTALPELLLLQMSESTAPSEKEILIGTSLDSRPENEAVKATIAELRDGNEDLAVVLVTAMNGKIIVTGDGEEALSRAIDLFISEYVKDGEISIREGERKSMTYSISQLLADRRAEELRVYNEALAKEIEAYNKRWENTNLSASEIEALQRLYALFTEESMLWLARLWDPETGGFYYSNSARDYEGFLPDVEDTAFALGDLIGADKLFPTTEDFLDRLAFWGMDDFDTRLVKWVQSLQAPNGFFYHPQWGDRITDVGLFRHLNNSKSILNRFGAAPLLYATGDEIRTMAVKHLLASVSGSSGGGSNLPPYMQSEETMIAWLDTFNWGRNQSYHSASVVGEMGATLQSIGLLDVVIDYFDEMFTIYENGTFESEIDMMSLNGVMKVCGLYRTAKRTFPYFEKVLDATIAVMENDEMPTLICSVANPWTVLYTLRSMVKTDLSTAASEITRLTNALAGATDEETRTQLEGELAAAKAAEEMAKARLAYFESEIAEHFGTIVDKTIARLNIFRKSDGAFSMYPANCGATAVGVQWSLKLPESDVNGTNLALNSVIARIFYVLDEPSVPIYSPETREKVLQILVNAEPVQKKRIENLEKTEDFEQLTTEDLLTGAGAGVSTSKGTTSIKSDGTRGNVLEHISVAGTSSNFFLNITATNNLRYYEIAFDMNLVSSTDAKGGGIMQIYLGSTYMLQITAKESTFTIQEANTNNPSATGGAEFVKNTLRTDLSKNEWYRLRIVAARHEETTQFLVYLTDGSGVETLIGNSECFYNQGLDAGATPLFPINSFKVLCYTKMDVTVRLDEVKMVAKETIPDGLPAIKRPAPDFDRNDCNFETVTLDELLDNGTVTLKSGDVSTQEILLQSGNNVLKYHSPAGTNTNLKYSLNALSGKVKLSLSFMLEDADSGTSCDVFFGNLYMLHLIVDGNTLKIEECNSTNTAIEGYKKRMLFDDLSLGVYYTLELTYDPSSAEAPITLSILSSGSTRTVTSDLLRTAGASLSSFTFNAWTKRTLTLYLDDVSFAKVTE